MPVTYSPEDNKLRLYVGRVPRDEYEDLRKAGFTSTPKQDCDFVATWTPSREDMARRYLDDDEDIEDEDYSATERSADRAERFSGYRDKRADEAGVSADKFDAGPSAYGHQNLARAERCAKRHDRHRTCAVSQWSKAEYWQERTRGVIAHALHRSSPQVRRGRIKTLEAEQRKHLKTLSESQEKYDTWVKIATMEGADILLPLNDEGYVIGKQLNDAQRLAYSAVQISHVYLYHPTSEGANEQCRNLHSHGFTGYDFLTNTEFLREPFERLTPKQYAELYLSKVATPMSVDSYSYRWAKHYELRLEYERAMLEAEGGAASNVEMIAGGFIGKHQILRVHKSPATKCVVSVDIWGPHPYRQNDDGTPEMGPQNCNIERLSADAYRPPTEQELVDFCAKQKEIKAAAKAEKGPTLPLINPTEADANRLTKHWNSIAAERHAERVRTGKAYSNYDPIKVIVMTQAEYSARSKDYAYETRTVYGDGRPSRRKTNMWSQAGQAYDESLTDPKCKLRMRYHEIIVLTDKPQKPLPLDWQVVEAGNLMPAG